MYLFAEIFSEKILFLKKGDNQLHQENAWKLSVVNYDVLKVVYLLVPTRRFVRHNYLASLLKILLFHRWSSHILLVPINCLVSPKVEHYQDQIRETLNLDYYLSSGLGTESELIHFGSPRNNRKHVCLLKFRGVNLEVTPFVRKKINIPRNKY